MKKFIIQYKLLGIMLLLLGFSTMGQPFEKSRKITRTFSISREMELQVSNKYGDIELITWEKDSVRIVINLKVVTNKESKLSNTYDYIDFDFKHSEHYIVASTSFAGKGSFWSDVKDLANSVFAGGTKTQINYTVYLPKNIAVRIENKYGNIYASDHDGAVNIYLSNGDLKVHSFNGKSFINLQFANANINYMAYGDLYLGYFSELQLNEADRLKIKSRSSRLTIDKSGSLEINSIRDKYFLGSVDEIIAVNSFTYFKIENIKKEIKIDANYGDVIIKNIDDDANNIIINGESTDITIYKDENQFIKIDLIYNEKAGIFFPAQLSNKVSVKENEEKKLVRTTGTLGADHTNIHISANIISGNFRINNK